MSLDRSLKSASTLVRHRNVLTRDERLAKLREAEKWSADKNSPLGLPKVGHRKAAVGKALKKEEGDEAAVGAAPAGKAAGGKAAAGKAAPAAKAAAGKAAAGKAAPAGKAAAGKAAPAAKKK